MTAALELTQWQTEAFHKIEETKPSIIYLLGGRGSGKTTLAQAIVLDEVFSKGDMARILWLRKEIKGLHSVERDLLGLLTRILGPTGFSFNGNKKLYTIPTERGSATIQLDQIDEHSSVHGSKALGQSISLCVVDEAGQFSNEQALFGIISNLRIVGGRNQLVLCANPGNGGPWLVRKTSNQAHPGELYRDRETGLPSIFFHSTFKDNPHLPDNYEASLEAATIGDPQLREAWKNGTMTLAVGAMFADVFDESRNVIEAWDGQDFPRELIKHTVAGFDHGSRSPAVFLWVARDIPFALKSLCGKTIPRGSHIFLDEYATWDGQNLHNGLGLVPFEIAEGIKEMFERYNLTPRAIPKKYSDPQIWDAIGGFEANGGRTLNQDYRKYGLNFERGNRTDKAGRVSQFREGLKIAGMDRPGGIFITRACQYLRESLPVIERSKVRPDSMASKAPDHGVDAACFALYSHGTTARYGSAY